MVFASLEREAISKEAGTDWPARLRKSVAEWVTEGWSGRRKWAWSSWHMVLHSWSMAVRSRGTTVDRASKTDRVVVAKMWGSIALKAARRATFLYTASAVGGGKVGRVMVKESEPEPRVTEV